MLITKHKITKAITINKLAFIALALVATSCSKHSSNIKESESINYTLGIDKSTGDVRMFKYIAQDKDFLLYDNGHTLIHKNEVQTIKTYSGLEEQDPSEIQELSRLYNRNEFKINASRRQTRNPNSQPLCIFQAANIWVCNMVLLALNISDMPSNLKEAIGSGINMWKNANPNLYFHMINVEDGEKIPEGFTVIKFYKASYGNKFAASTIGARPANQGLVYFSEHCDSIDVAHHIGHVLGYIDENVRTQRRTFIDVHTDALHIIERFMGRAESVALRGSLFIMDVHDNTPPFDRYSIMMVPSYTLNPVMGYLLENAQTPLFTSLTEARIIPKNTRLSAEDVRRINKVYPPIDDDDLRNTCK